MTRALTRIGLASICLLAAVSPALAGDGAPFRPAFGVINYAVLIGYLAALVAMGVYFSRREKTTDDYFLAGRRIPWWAAGLSVFGGGLSAITYMATPGKAYGADWTMILRSLFPILLIPIVVAFYIPFYRRLKVTSAYEYLERRFNLPARLYGSLLFAVFQFGRMAIIMVLPALALSTVTGMDVLHCIVVMGVLATAYTFLGGIEAVIWTDVLQVIVLLGAAVLSLILIAVKVDGGLAGIVSAGAAETPSKFHTFNWTWDYTAASVWVLAVGSFLGQVMPNTADQSVVQRYLTTPDERGAKRAAWTGALMGIPTAFLFFFLGTALFVFYKANPSLMTKGLANDAILPFFVMQQMPTGVAGLVIAGIFAAAMSSIDSGMNSVATAITTDFYRRRRPGASETDALRFARWATVAVGVIATLVAVVIAQRRQESLLDLFFFILYLLGGSLGGLFALGIFTRRAHGPGALVGAAVGMAAPLLARAYTNISPQLFAAIGLTACIIVGYLASLILPGGGKDVTGLTVYSMPKADEAAGE